MHTPLTVVGLFWVLGRCITTQAALVDYCHGKNSAMGVSGSSVVFVCSPHTFDPSLGEFMATWMAGAIVAVATKTDTFSRLQQCLKLSRASHLMCTPSIFSTVHCEPAELPFLVSVGLGGEGMNKGVSKIT